MLKPSWLISPYSDQWSREGEMSTWCGSISGTRLFFLLKLFLTHCLNGNPGLRIAYTTVSTILQGGGRGGGLILVKSDPEKETREAWPLKVKIFSVPLSRSRCDRHILLDIKAILLHERASDITTFRDD